MDLNEEITRPFSELHEYIRAQLLDQSALAMPLMNNLRLVHTYKLEFERVDSRKHIVSIALSCDGRYIALGYDNGYAEVEVHNHDRRLQLLTLYSRFGKLLNHGHSFEP